ncbi:hypothetical protein [Thermoflavifilum thermophilum]|uniref:Uncharacterized protein n=1 Tax=Thermoflavifilum thermophilum TaxID=1393122 RepID=A0A1I7NDD3_9BACT|nr:hypothetical protein [Thermoflavifilum thermophilum]SFV32670.1 hypothetical protein SAMN05660895_1418 [Thermoflavifilum thermophilum]
MPKPTEETDEVRQEWMRLTRGRIQPPGHPDFDVPGDYFTFFLQQLKARLMEKKDPACVAQDAIRKEADLPEKKIPRQLPFVVPENYFETFPEQLMQKLGAQPPLPAKRKWLSGRMIRAALAACLVGMGVVGWWMYQRQQSIEARLERVPTEAIAQYLELHTDLFNSDLIVHQLGNSEISLSLPSPTSYGGITPDDIREYLDLDSLPDASFMQ